VNHRQYLDAVTHWKERFNDSQIVILDLQRRLVQREQEIETLKSTSTVARVPESSSISLSNQKRASPDKPCVAPSKWTKASSGSITSTDQRYSA